MFATCGISTRPMISKLSNPTELLFYRLSLFGGIYCYVNHTSSILKKLFLSKDAFFLFSIVSVAEE